MNALKLLAMIVAIAVLMVLVWVALLGFGWIGIQSGTVIAKWPWFVTGPLYAVIGLVVVALSLLVLLFFVASVWVVATEGWRRAVRWKARVSKSSE